MFMCMQTWSHQVSTLELLQTLAANAAAPFVLCSRLAPLLAPRSPGERCGQIVNVSALEGEPAGCNGPPPWLRTPPRLPAWWR